MQNYLFGARSPQPQANCAGIASAIAFFCTRNPGGIGLSWMAIGAIAPLVFASPVQAAALTHWGLDLATNQLEITVPSGITPRYFLAAEPARIVLDLPNTEMGAVPTQQNYSAGAIRQIRVAQFQPGQTRIVIELASDTVLAPGQVELRRIGQEQTGDRWVLRPLLAGDMPPVAATSSLPTSSLPTSPLPRTVTTPSMVFPASGAFVLSPEPSNPATSNPATSNPTNSNASALANLPPLEPGALQIPVSPAPGGVIAPIAPPQTASEATTAIALPTGDRPNAQMPSSLPSLAELPAPEPLASPTSSPSSVPSVPSLQPAPAPELTPSPSSPETTPAPATTPSPNSPANNSPASGNTPNQAAPNAAPNNVIEFGQPLPLQSSLLPATVLIPAGTILNLRYPGTVPLALSLENPRQEVLLLDQDVRDRTTGNVIIPANSQVIGRFETSSTGSRFITQAISWQDQNLLLKAESDVLRPNQRQASERSPIIRPNQVMKVRLMEDVISGSLNS
ncbi:MAG: AMIN domain-containing protein [Leptolyngbyaceae cyanobacterium CRU_2_3]|nr:AMIN domain-containing protein [Leptolyngbyaceae cyanobacterium CRU_2_3]